MAEAPKMRIAAQLDRKTGVIHRTIRGNNFIVDANAWEEVTDDKRVLELFSTEGAKKLLLKKGKLRTKPRLRIEVSAVEFEVEDGKVDITFKVEGGSVEDIPSDLKLKINNKEVEFQHLETIELKSKVINRLTIKIVDDRVYAPKAVSVRAVPKGTVGSPPPMREPEPVTVEITKRTNG